MTHGVLNISKPRGASSHQMVSLVRRLFQQKRVGHAGTLDPLAEGVLPVLLGRATRLADLVSAGEKVYYADVLLGSVSSTDDLEGEVLATSPVPDFTEAELAAALAAFVGEITQVPPIYSAIKIAGETSYRRARRGEHMDMPTRLVRIDAIDLIGRTRDRLTIVVRCGSGTYIRALARDIGEALGCGATLARLVRLRVGSFSLGESLSPNELQYASQSGTLSHHLLPPDAACLQVPAIALDEIATDRARKGQGWPAAAGHADCVRAYGREGAFLGLARREPDRDGIAEQSWWRLRVMVEGA